MLVNCVCLARLVIYVVDQKHTRLYHAEKQFTWCQAQDIVSWPLSSYVVKLVLSYVYMP